MVLVLEVRECNSGKTSMVTEEVVFCDLKLPIEDVEELSLDPSDISLPKYTSAECPVNVLESRVVKVL